VYYFEVFSACILKLTIQEKKNNLDIHALSILARVSKIFFSCDAISILVIQLTSIVIFERPIQCSSMVGQKSLNDSKDSITFYEAYLSPSNTIKEQFQLYKRK
jgi:hypothetical protein